MWPFLGIFRDNFFHKEEFALQSRIFFRSGHTVFDSLQYVFFFRNPVEVFSYPSTTATFSLNNGDGTLSVDRTAFASPPVTGNS